MDKGIRVLLVDDEETFARNLERLLKFRGFDTAVALDGYSALASLQDPSGFDVVVLDVKMPGMDGIATLKQIRKSRPKVEVIMLTGHATVESGVQSIREGAYDYLMKPCDIEDLAEKIREACRVEQIRNKPVLWPRNRVKEITWPVFFKLRTTDRLQRAFNLFNREKRLPAWESLYILDRADHLVGTVKRSDLIQAARQKVPDKPIDWSDLKCDPELLPDMDIAAVMRTGPHITTHPEEALTTAARRMIEHNIRCMPVVDNDRVRGFIRLQDIFQHANDTSQ
ncbi:MAG: response regulator [Deltaproteobacteria bacterium]|nr:response regulator [Deltaproteobacteria bacterium]